MPGTIPATSQLDWLISITAINVLSWSRAARHRLRSFTCGMGNPPRVCSQRRWCHALATRPIASLDLGFLVDREHHGVGWRMHVEADNVLDLFGEGGVGGTLEGAQAVRLEAVLFPDALDRAQ